MTAYSYDHNGNLSRVTRASGDSSYERVVDYTYDGLNRVRTETQYPNWPSTSSPLVMSTTYDLNGNRSVVTDQQTPPRTTTFSYDRLNRLTDVDYSDSGTPDVTYTYDANGNRLTMVSNSSKTAYCYDELSRLLSVTTGLSTGASISCPNVSGGSRVGYRYDLDGNRTKLLYPNGDAVTYAFNAGSQLATVTDWASRVTQYAYYPDGALQTQTNVNGTVASYSYDSARRLTEVWNKTSTSATDAITRHQFTLDNVGNRTQVVETLAPLAASLPSGPSALPTPHATPTSLGSAPSVLPTGHLVGATPTTAPSSLPTRPTALGYTLTYGYDTLYRLTSASGGPAGSTSYTYDPVGNRLSRTRNGTSSLSYAYDRADRITSAGATSYTIDAVGNMTVRGADCLGYDQANRLKTLDSGCNSSTDASYAYDGDGKRTSKTVGSTTTIYVYDVNRGLPVLLEDGTRRYVWGLGLAYEVEGSNALVYHVDGLGSVRALTDSSKAVVQTYESDEFGVPITTSGGSAQPFGFTGEQRDPESSMVNLRARYYDPVIGRFISRDRWSGGAGQSMTLNHFTYAENNPVSGSDHSGFCTDPAPGSPYIRYCIETFIPGAWAPIPGVGDSPFRGDDRGPSSTGGTFRTHQQITRDENGNLRESHTMGDSEMEMGPIRETRVADLWWCGAMKARTLRSTTIRATCAGSDGQFRGVAPPVHYDVVIDETDGSIRVTSVEGTKFPSLEIWQYGPDGAKLLFFYDAAAAGTDPFTGLTVPAIPLPNSAP